MERRGDGRCKNGQMQDSEEDQDALSEGMNDLHLKSEWMVGSVSTEETNESEGENERNVDSPTRRNPVRIALFEDTRWIPKATRPSQQP